MSLKDAANLVGVTPKALWAAISKGLLKGKKQGRDWFVTRKALDDWQRNQIHKSGRPRKSS